MTDRNVNGDEIMYEMMIHHLEQRIDELIRINDRNTEIIRKLYARILAKESNGDL